MRATGAAPVTIRRLAPPADWLTQLALDARRGFTATPKRLPSKYFYDARGSALFEMITRLPEYYLTRTETGILEERAGDLISQVRPEEIIEFGSGSSRKTRVLLEMMHTTDAGSRYVPIDVSEGALKEALREMCSDYPWLEIDGLVGDFVTDLCKVRRRGRRLLAFFGSTIGNFEPAARAQFLRQVRASMSPRDGFLLGVDLVKDEARMVAAYDDAAGVSAEFNRNILRVVNRHLDGDIPVDTFDHVTRYNREDACMEQSLRATHDVVARLDRIDLTVTFAAGERIFTERSCKFTRNSVERSFSAAGMKLRRWLTDADGDFALALGKPKRS